MKNRLVSTPPLAIALVAVACAQTAIAGDDPTTFTEVQKLVDAGGGFMDYNGSSVATDGIVMVTGSRQDHDAPALGGSVFVYRLVDGEWVEEQQLIPSNPESIAEFGHAVDVQGDRIFVGAWREDALPSDGPFVFDIGATYVFEFDGETWNETQRLTASDMLEWNEFGSAVAIDGDRALIGSAHVPDACIGEKDPLLFQNCHSGAAYIFEYDGEKWVEIQKLVASDTEVKDLFGREADLEGDVAIIGAFNEGNTAGPCPPTCDINGHGAVYVFRLVEGEWIEEQKLVPDGIFPGQGDWFGWHASIDSGRIVVGSQGDDDLGTNVGAVYIYVHDGDEWVLEEKLLPPTTEAGAFIGKGVDVFGDVLVAGGDGVDLAGQSSAGTAYVYLFDGANWNLGAQLLADDADQSDWFGQNVSIAHGQVLVSAIGDDQIITDAGAGYVYRGMADCNGNDVLDAVDIASGESLDRNGDFVPDECACAPDLDGSGSVGFSDLLLLLDAWNTTDADADLDGSGTVGFADLLLLLDAWGPCS